MVHTTTSQDWLQIQGRFPTQLRYYTWRPSNNKHEGTSTSVQAVVHIVHGMVEHLGRYDEFARFLTRHGVAVVGTDHRGHGLSANHKAPLGYFGDGVTWDRLVEDIHVVRTQAHNDFPGVPYVIFGHSMGSFMVRDYITRYPQGIAGAAIIGTGTWPGFLGNIGRGMAAILGKVAPRTPGRLLTTLSFGPYEKPFERRTAYDWLSRDRNNVDDYVADPLCGTIASNAFFTPLLTGIHSVHQPDAFQICSDLALYIASGEVDPVGGARAVEEVTDNYAHAGLANITSHIYENDRHEIFNEIDKDVVWQDFLKWLSRTV